jgi:hypothetical protein
LAPPERPVRHDARLDEATVFIDARNVVRSRWPNLREAWFVERTGAWAELEAIRALVVFDGRAPASEEGPRVRVVGTGSGSADDWIAREAERLSEEGHRLWLVTSDRGLRERVGARAERTIGGGTFASLLAELAAGKR